MTTQNTTHFGFETVPIQQKKTKVAEVFSSVATRYDLMNDVMSLGLHRIWKRFAIMLGNFRPGQHVLDLAGGTGDLAKLIHKRVGPRGRVVVADINEDMLKLARDRCLDSHGGSDVIEFMQVDAEVLPFDRQSFERVIMGFGLRNVTDQEKTLSNMYGVLKPGGLCIILEFSQVHLPFLKRIYDAYSFKLLPKFGKWIANDEDSYRYLVESIRKHPDQHTLSHLMRQVGFEDVHYHNIMGGVVAIHLGYKY